MLAVLPEHYLRSGLIYNTKNILFSKINSLYTQYDIDAGWVMTFLLYKNSPVSAVFAGIKNPVSKEQNRPFKRSPHCEKGRSAHFSSLFGWIKY